MALLTSGEVGGGAPCTEAPISLRFLTYCYCQRLSVVGALRGMQATTGRTQVSNSNSKLEFQTKFEAPGRSLAWHWDFRSRLMIGTACFKLKQLPGVVAEMSSNELSPALGL